MKYLLALTLFVGTLFAGQPDSTTQSISRDAVLKNIEDTHAQLNKQFQYSLTPEQLALQEKIKAALVQYQTISAIKQDSLRVAK